MTELVKRTLEIASGEVGVTEEGGDNFGPRVEEYLRSVGLGPGNAWCAAFVYWCIEKASKESGVKNPFCRTGYCPSITNWAKEYNILSQTPEPGDVFLLCDHISAYHTGFVESVNGGAFQTIEGNTNLDGSANGYGVFRRTRYNGNKYLFVKWSQLAAEPEKKFKLYINEEHVYDMPLYDGRAFCPIRLVGEKLGYEVGWNQELQVALFNGKEVRADIMLKGSQAFAPIRDIADSFDEIKMKVDSPDRKVFISKSQ